MTAATQVPCGPQTRGAQQSMFWEQGPQVPLLHARPLQSQLSTQLEGVAHARVGDGVRIDSS